MELGIEIQMIGLPISDRGELKNYWKEHLMTNAAVTACKEGFPSAQLTVGFPVQLLLELFFHFGEQVFLFFIAISLYRLDFF